MNKIVVTGGSGRLGRLVVDSLVAQGKSVLSVDVSNRHDCSCPTLVADVTKAGEAHDALQNADAVIHLAAISGPSMRTESTIFEINVSSTYHIVAAAVAQKLSRIVFVSSLFTLGWHADANFYWPKYAPVDESHPVTPFESYALSKVVGEEICAAACRSSGISAASLRITNIIQVNGYHALPWTAPTPAAGVRFVLWPYTDVRDAATACCQALLADFRGHEAMYIAAADTRFDAPTEPLLQKLAPSVEIRRPMPGRASVIDTSKARALIGYQPQHDWAIHCAHIQQDR
jgi:nucleoside-diphosphate-sugar epimerase